MAVQRLFYWMWRVVACGVHSFDESEMDEEVELEIVESDVESMAESNEAPTQKPLSRLDSLERGFQTVMHKARTFAHKWSQPDIHFELMMCKEETKSESELRGDSVELEVERDSSQARFEHLMQRTSRFYERCSMLQRHPHLLAS